MNDILKANIAWKPVWYLLGNGPTLKYSWPRILCEHQTRRDNSQVIVANGAICVYPLPEYWLVRDINLIRYPWFAEMYADYIGIKIFGSQYEREVPNREEFGELRGQFAPFPGDYSWIDGTAINHDTAFTVPGVLRPGTTAGGDMFQLACLSGAEEIYLAGIDQKGRGYANDDVCHRPPGVNDGRWNSVNRFNGLIKRARKMGIKVRSFTPTELDIEVI